MRRATWTRANAPCSRTFQSTLSMRRATPTAQHMAPRPMGFQSTLSMRRATCRRVCGMAGVQFQYTLSMRRATAYLRHAARSPRFQSTLSMRRATWLPRIRCLCLRISIHALHEESDLADAATLPGLAISIHALHEESDRRTQDSTHAPLPFQSTLSMRRATLFLVIRSLKSLFQSTLSMRRATL